MLSRLQRLRNAARGSRRHQPRLEPLEDRTLLTLFTISAVPDAIADQEAVAIVGSSAHAQRSVRVGVDCDAFPAGQGDHQGSFYLGAATDRLQIDSSPDAGQQVGDPITVAFVFSYTSLLQNFDGYPPQNEAHVAWHGFLDAGDATQPLFDGFFSTDFTDGDESHDAQLIPIHMNVGDSIVVHLTSNGVAYAAEPHYKDRVAFFADFVVSDLVGTATVPAAGRLPLVLSLVSDQHPGQPIGGSDPANQPAELAVPLTNPVELPVSQRGALVDGAGGAHAQHHTIRTPLMDHPDAILLPDWTSPSAASWLS